MMMKAKVTENRCETSASLLEIKHAGSAYFVDFDDTLIGSQPDPTRFELPGELKKLVAILADAPSVLFCIVSGRSVAQLDSFFFPLRLPAIGCHGCEARLDPDGPIVSLAPKMTIEFQNEIKKAAKEYETYFIEDKRYTMALHPRIETKAALNDALDKLIKTYGDNGYDVCDYGRCLEVRPKGTSKGKALKYVLGKRDFFCGQKAVYIGDDAVNDNSLQFVRERNGELIHVGKGNPEGYACLSGPEEVIAYLRQIVEMA